MDFKRLVHVQKPVVFQKIRAGAGASWSCTSGGHRHSKHQRFGGMFKGSTKALSSQVPHVRYLAQSDLAQDTKKLQQSESGQLGPGPIINQLEKKVTWSNP